MVADPNGTVGATRDMRVRRGALAEEDRFIERVDPDRKHAEAGVGVSVVLTTGDGHRDHTSIQHWDPPGDW